MKKVMRIKLSLIVACVLLVMPMNLSAKDTYRVSSYRWKAYTSGGSSWSAQKKADFDIEVDEQAGTVTIGGPKQVAGVYQMRDEHAKGMENNNPRYEGVVYCVAGDCNEIHRVYLREDSTTGGVKWIIFGQGSAQWMFEVEKR